MLVVAGHRVRRLVPVLVVLAHHLDVELVQPLGGQADADVPAARAGEVLGSAPIPDRTALHRLKLRQQCSTYDECLISHAIFSG